MSLTENVEGSRTSRLMLVPRDLIYDAFLDPESLSVASEQGKCLCRMGANSRPAARQNMHSRGLASYRRPRYTRPLPRSACIRAGAGVSVFFAEGRPLLF